VNPVLALHEVCLPLCVTVLSVYTPQSPVSKTIGNVPYLKLKSVKIKYSPCDGFETASEMYVCTTL